MARINLISWDNGVGLSRDLELLAAALASDPAIDVAVTRRGRGKWRKLARPLGVRAATLAHRLRRGPKSARFDLNIMLEHVWPEYLPWARYSAFIPNPEWCRPRDVAALDRIACVLVKTRAAERIFQPLAARTAFIGFTSPDRHDAAVERERAFFHLAGRSQNKGTEALLALWRRHREWPRLTVVQSPRVARPAAAAANIRHIVGYLDDAELRRLQNAHRFHLCPSETEGFGHYLVEAMSVGALAITLDAPPMNELVGAERGVLVAPSRNDRQNLATRYFFDAETLAASIDRVLAIDDAALDSHSTAARAWYVANHAAFAPRLLGALRATALLGEHDARARADPAVR